MKHALWLGLFLVWSSVGLVHAQQLRPAQLQARAAALALAHPEAQPLELSVPLATGPAELALTPPCLGCRAGLRSATHDYAPDPSPPVPAAQAVPPRTNKRQYALGDSWKLGGGRTLSVRLTPTPEECAPLVRLSF